MTETTVQGLYLTPPHGELIAGGDKVAIAKGRPMGLEGEWILLSGRHAYGHMRVGDPETVDLEDFKARRSEHGVSEVERLRWWPERSPLYLYPVEQFQPYPNGPLEVLLPSGVQTRVDVKGLGLPGENLGLEMRIKARRSRGGRWRTLKDGRRVMVTTTARVSKQVRSRMAAWSEEILRQGLEDGNEHAVVLNNQGIRLGKTIDGTHDTIDMRDFEWKGEQHVFIHNHPSGSAFSGADVGVFMSHPEHEHMIAVGHDGSMYRVTKTERAPSLSQLAKEGRRQYPLSLRQPGSPLTETRHWAALGAQAEQQRQIAVLFGEYQTKVTNKTMTPEVAWREHTHRSMIQTARNLGLEYEKVYLGGH